MFFIIDFIVNLIIYDQSIARCIYDLARQLPTIQLIEEELIQHLKIVQSKLLSFRSDYEIGLLEWREELDKSTRCFQRLLSNEFTPPSSSNVYDTLVDLRDSLTIAMNDMAEVMSPLTTRNEPDRNDDIERERREQVIGTIKELREQLRLKSVELSRMQDKLLEKDYTLRVVKEKTFVDCEETVLEMSDIHCGLCLAVYIDPVTVACGHSACHYCWAKLMHLNQKKSRQLGCPWCTGPLPSTLHVSVALRSVVNMYTGHMKSCNYESTTERPNCSKPDFPQELKATVDEPYR